MERYPVPTLASPASLIRHRAVTWLALVLMVLTVTGCAVSKSPITGNKRAYGYSWEQEKQLGREADPQIVAQYGELDDAALTAYVRAVGERVLAESHLRRETTDPEFRDVEFTFRVLDSPVVNAFALPGGFVYVTRGLLSHLNNEAQLAVVLGHEITHVAGRHASKRAAKAQFAQIGLIGGAILGQAVYGGSAAENILGVGSGAAQLLLLKYGRDDERESDQYGVEYSALAGYQAGEGAAFFTSLRRIQEEAGATIPTWQSSHPDPGQREQYILQSAAEWAEQVTMNRIDEEEFLREIDGIVMGENPREGFVENSMFYHPELRFQFPVPSGFGLQNGRSQVAMFDQNQQAIMIFTFAQDATSAQQAATEFGQQEGVQVRDSGSQRVNGHQSSYVVADATTEQGVLRLRATFIEFGGSVYYFLGYTAQANFDTFDNRFRETMQGFDDLTDRSKLNVEPSRLRLVRASRTATFRELVPSNLPEQFSATDLAIINQVELDDTIQRGRTLKMPR